LRLRRRDDAAGPRPDQLLLLVLLDHFFLLDRFHPRRAFVFATGAELLYVEVEDRRDVEGQRLREQEAADDGEAEGARAKWQHEWRDAPRASPGRVRQRDGGAYSARNGVNVLARRILSSEGLRDRPLRVNALVHVVVLASLKKPARVTGSSVTKQPDSRSGSGDDEMAAT